MTHRWIARIAVVLVSAPVFMLAPTGRAQEKGTAFFDPDETSARRAQGVEALKLICPGGAIADNAAGCLRCPDETGMSDDSGLTWNLARVFTGHFTSTAAGNLILSGRGCESHSQNFGGSFVFVSDGAGLKLLRYDPALITERCHQFEVKREPNRLVCTDDWGAQVMLWSYVYEVSFDEDGDSNVSRIFETIDLSRQHCGIDFFTGKPTFVQESHLTGLKMGKSWTGLPVLFIEANFGKRFPTDEERKACEHGLPIPLALPTYRLEFIFDGDTFQPSEQTKGSLKAFPKPEPPEDSYATKH